MSLHFPPEHDECAFSIANRRFDPSKLFSPNIDEKLIEVFRGPWVYVGCRGGDICKHCGLIPGHLGCFVIAVDGACTNNGLPNAKAAVGVFTGYESEYSFGVELDNLSQPTSQQAELIAGILALNTALNIRKTAGIEKEGLHELVIKTDSEYMVQGITRYITKWKINGYLNAKGKEVKNASLFEKLDTLVTRLNSYNIKVMFWLVPRESNRIADSIASEVLEA